MSQKQKADLQAVWDSNKGVNQLDYVTGWHAQALKFFAERKGKFGYVTTNSIVQGQPVPALFGPIFEAGWRISFAHRTFAWDSEAHGKAKVHCVIIGFDREAELKPRLWDYSRVKDKPVELSVRQGINAYLVDGPNILVESRNRVLSPLLPTISFGSMPNDGGNLILDKNDLEVASRDPIAAKYLRPFRMGRELLHGSDRWCLWMKDNFDPADLKRSEFLKERVEAVRIMRSKSKRAATQKLASTPHLFGENRQPDHDYVGIPAVVSELRPYYTAQLLSKEVIAGNKIFVADDPKGLLFSLISSSMFLTWQKTVGGRLKSDLNFSITLVWNNFPVPKLNKTSEEKIIQAGREVLNARKLHPERSLADHYNPSTISAELFEAHDALDQEVDTAFGAPKTIHNERQRQKVLFQQYAALTSR